MAGYSPKGRKELDTTEWLSTHIHTIPMAESEEELKSLLMSVKEESGKAGLKLNIQKKTKIVASKPVTSQQIEWGKVEAVADFIFLGSKVTEDRDYSHEIKTLAPGKKTYDKPR